MKNIIIFDSRVYIRYRIRQALRDSMYEAHEVSTSRELYLMLNELKYLVELIIMDINLYNEDGLKIIKELRDKNIKIPIMVVTEINTKENIIKTIMTGANDYFLKPFSEDVILKRIERNVEIVEKQKMEKLNTKSEKKKITPKDLRSVIEQYILKAKADNSYITIVMCLFFKANKSNIDDKEYLTLTDYIYEELKDEIKGSKLFAQYGLQNFVILYDNCDSKKAEEVLKDLDAKSEYIKSQKEKISDYLIKNVCVTYPGDGENAEQLLEKLEEKLKDIIKQVV